jgi:CNT family concentrative nucleoside transporter
MLNGAIPVFGLLAILAVAWLISLDRGAVRLRPIAFGLGVQFLLSLAVLRDDAWSFAGMSILGLWIGVFALRSEGRESSPVRRSVRRLLFLIAAGLLSYLLPAALLATFIGLACLFLFATRTRRPLKAFRPWLAALLPVAGVAFLAQLGLHGLGLLEILGDRVAAFLQLADYGSKFLFGNLADSTHYFPDSPTWPGFGYLFAFKLLPVIVFFAAFASVLYWLGIMQLVIEGVSRFMRWTMGTSGAETLNASANIFIGQTEAPLLIRPYLARATGSELFSVMVAGFATIAGGVLVGYISLGIPAAHLLAASVMSAPAALVISKIVLPETEHPQTAGDVRLPDIDVGDNIIEAATNGIQDGLRLAVNVGAMLIGFIALMAVVDSLLNYADTLVDGVLLGGDQIKYETLGFSPVGSEYPGVFPGSLRTLFGVLLRPVAWLLGVPWAEAARFGNLLGIKLSLNEFVAFGTLATHLHDGSLSERSIQIATYALCGFANVSSIGMQIGGLAALAPNRRGELARFGLRAMIAGALASWMTAAIAALQL